MRLTAAAVFLATLVAAHPQGLESSHGHVVAAKRHAEVARNLTSAADIEARWDGFDHLNLERDLGTYGPDDVETFGDADEDTTGLFASADEDGDDWEKNWHPEPHQIMNATERDHIKRTFADPDDPEYLNVKHGLAWTNEVPKAWPVIGKVKWYGLYSWTEWKPVETTKYGIRFFPMLKSNKKEKIDKWVKTVKPGYGKDWMMGPNEVNIPSQSPMTPSEAAGLIRKYMFPLITTTPGDKKYKMVSPSFANGDSAFTWLRKFRDTQADVWKKTDVINLHYYGTDVAKIIAYLEAFYKEFGKPIWLSEFGCHSFTKKAQCNSGQAQDMINKIKKYCYEHKYCKAYFLYGTYVNSRVGVSKVNAIFSNTSGGLTAAGKIFLAN